MIVLCVSTLHRRVYGLIAPPSQRSAAQGGLTCPSDPKKEEERRVEKEYQRPDYRLLFFFFLKFAVNFGSFGELRHLRFCVPPEKRQCTRWSPPSRRRALLHHLPFLFVFSLPRSPVSFHLSILHPHTIDVSSSFYLLQTPVPSRTMAEDTPTASAPAGEQVAEQRAPDTETKPAEQPAAEAPQEKEAEKAAEPEKEKPAGIFLLMGHLFLPIFVALVSLFLLHLSVTHPLRT